MSINFRVGRCVFSSFLYISIIVLFLEYRLGGFTLGHTSLVGQCHFPLKSIILSSFCLVMDIIFVNSHY